MSDIGDLIAVGLLGEPNGLGLTANQAHEIGNRIARHLPSAVPSVPELTAVLLGMNLCSMEECRPNAELIVRRLEAHRR